MSDKARRDGAGGRGGAGRSGTERDATGRDARTVPRPASKTTLPCTFFVKKFKKSVQEKRETGRSRELWHLSGVKWSEVEEKHRRTVAMFMGEYLHALDAKGRLIMPARFREELGEKFIITRGLDHCLFVYPIDEWRVLEEKVKALPTAKADVRAFVRMLFSGAVEAELDSQGRVLVPQNLREHAAIDKELYVIGVSTRIEIWGKERWENYAAEAEESYEEIAESIVSLGI